MMGKDNGGPAFPTENERQTGPSSWSYEGMSLRDYFVAHAPPVPDCYQPDDTPPMDWLAEKALPIDEQTDRRRAEEHRAFERVLSWPGYWADEQIKRRGE